MTSLLLKSGSKFMNSFFRRYLFPFDINELPQSTVEVAVIGSGVAGLQAARKLADVYSVRVFTKGDPRDSNTWRAQGGVAAALNEDDSPRLHYEDTLEAGAGLCDQPAVDLLVNEAREKVRDIVRAGKEFHYGDNGLELSREGGHSKNRVAHARGDATGEEIEEVLLKKVKEKHTVQFCPRTMVVDFLVDAGRVCGLLVLAEDNLEVVWTRGVVLATGGLGQLYRETTNHPVVTGDGLAAALRAGLSLEDPEFIQFHPTVLYLAGAPRFLITEALRGEGGLLRDINGERFMDSVHPRAELAPRDIVSRAILDRMIATDSSYVYLDVTELSPRKLQQQFPTVTSMCARYDIDVTRDFIPVRPCEHYSMGGVEATIHGETGLDNLYCAGEVACTGVHGANRLASNSLLEGLVVGAEAAEKMKQGLPEVKKIEFSETTEIDPDYQLDFSDMRKSLQSLLWRNAGILREKEKLLLARSQINKWFSMINQVFPTDKTELETVNMVYLGAAVIKAALAREESRGAHYRKDFPEPEEQWRKHTMLSLGEERNSLEVDYKPIATLAD